MSNTTLHKIDNVDGDNYIILSRLTQYEDTLTSDKFSIKSVHRGIERYVVEQQDHTVGADRFMIVNPMQEVEVVIDSSSEVIGTCYFFNPDLIQQIYSANVQPQEYHLDSPVSSDRFNFYNTPIHNYATFMYTAMQDVQTVRLWDKYRVSEYLIHLAEYMIEHQLDIGRRLSRFPAIKSSTHQELYRRIQQGRQYIHDRFAGAISIKDIARHACLSEYYFHRNFRLFFSCTPYQYLHQVRMTHAQDLMNADKHSVAEMAALCGYSDHKYFARSYRAWTRSAK